MTSFPSTPKKGRILTISKPYVSAAYRDKLLAWQEDGRYEIGLICPPAWAGQTFEPSAEDGRLWIKRLSVLADGHNHFHVYRGLKKAIREFRPTLLHVEEEHYSIVTWQALRHAVRLKIPATFYTWQNIDKVYPPPFCWIEKFVFAHAKAVAGNREAAEILKRKGYRDTVNIIPQMGVDLKRFVANDIAEKKRAAKQKRGWSAEQIWIGYAGRLVPEKAVDLLIRMLARLPEKFHLCILGDGPEQAQLEALASSLGVTNRVTFLRRVPSTEVAEVFFAFDLLALPSLTTPHWKEQFGRVLIEAMAAGTAVAGSDSGEIPHVVGDVGWILPEGDLDLWVETIGSLTLEECHARGIAGRARVEHLYSNEVVARQFLSLFDSLHDL